MEHDVPAIEVAAALAKLVQGEEPLLLKPQPERRERPDRGERSERGSRSERGERSRKPGERKAKSLKDNPDVDMERYRIDVGYDHGVKPGNIVGAIANEANLDANYIGHIQIFDSFSTVDLPSGMPKQTMDSLRKVWVCQQSLNIAPYNGEEGRSRGGKSDGRRKPGGDRGRKPRKPNEGGSAKPTSRPADKKPRVRKPKQD